MFDPFGTPTPSATIKVPLRLTLHLQRLGFILTGRLSILYNWCLDAVFAEDASCLRAENAAHNVSLLRRLALNLLRHQPPGKGSFKIERYRAGLDNSFLLEILSYAFPDSHAQHGSEF
jgi:hypothetical protein